MCVQQRGGSLPRVSNASEPSGSHSASGMAVLFVRRRGRGGYAPGARPAPGAYGGSSSDAPSAASVYCAAAARSISGAGRSAVCTPPCSPARPSSPHAASSSDTARASGRIYSPPSAVMNTRSPVRPQARSRAWRRMSASAASLCSRDSKRAQTMGSSPETPYCHSSRAGGTSCERARGKARAEARSIAALMSPALKPPRAASSPGMSAKPSGPMARAARAEASAERPSAARDMARRSRQASPAPASTGAASVTRGRFSQPRGSPSSFARQEHARSASAQRQRAGVSPRGRRVMSSAPSFTSARSPSRQKAGWFT